MARIGCCVDAVLRGAIRAIRAIRVRRRNSIKERRGWSAELVAVVVVVRIFASSFELITDESSQKNRETA